jgi:hypothetical protein
MRRSLARRFLFMGIPVFLLPTIVCSTTIIPFANLGEMTHVAEAVVMARLLKREELKVGDLTYSLQRMVVTHEVKGPLKTGDIWELPALGLSGPDWVKVIPDDVYLEEGVNYLLFLGRSGTGWRPLLLTYALFEEIAMPDFEVLVPVQSGFSLPQLSRPDGVTPEPLYVYRKDALLAHLEDILTGTPWDGRLALFSDRPATFWTNAGPRAAPSHCNYFNTRWLDFPGTPLPVRTDPTGDTDCDPPSLGFDYTNNAVAELAAQYLGIHLTGPTNWSGYNPSCAGNTVLGTPFLNWMWSTYGSYRNLITFYNDPCNEILPLNNCGGTLAVGGLYAFGPGHSYDGDDYWNGGAGFVIFNNGVCQCLSDENYTIVMIHELTHGLALDHIAGDGTANMNPTCCNSISSSLDIACVDYLYQPAPLPVEWLFLRAEEQGASVALHWATASEQGSAWYDVERSSDGARYSFLGRVPAAGHSLSERHYAFTDGQPCRDRVITGSARRTRMARCSTVLWSAWIADRIAFGWKPGECPAMPAGRCTFSVRRNNRPSWSTSTRMAD